MNDCSFVIADCLSTGAENAKNTKYLARTYNLTSREIQLMIEAERRAGALICSNFIQGTAPGTVCIVPKACSGRAAGS